MIIRCQCHLIWVKMAVRHREQGTLGRGQSGEEEENEAGDMDHVHSDVFLFTDNYNVEFAILK